VNPDLLSLTSPIFVCISPKVESVQHGDDEETMVLTYFEQKLSRRRLSSGLERSGASILYGKRRPVFACWI
jgi:hypothetical protein